MFHPRGPTFLELVVEALSSTERGYDLLAPKFDYTPYRTPDWVLEPVMERVGEAGAALDLCCGTGAAMRWLRPRCRRVVGLDFSQGMLDTARELSQRWPGAAELEFVRGDALATPFAEGEFDLVTIFGALGHILPRDEPRLVREVRRVLSPGGRFVFVTSEHPPLLSTRFWRSVAFNLAMKVRNALLKPEFIMYYLTFLLPEARALLEREGFRVEVWPQVIDGDLKMVEATRVA